MISEYLRKTPFVKIILPFAAGILLQLVFQFASNISILILTLSLSASLLLALLFIYNKYKFRYLWGISITLVFLSLGFFRSMQDTNSRKINEEVYNSPVQIIKISDIKAISGNIIKTKANIIAYQNNGRWVPANYESLIFINDTSNNKNYNPGECYIVESKVTKIPGPIAPYQFNYSDYLKNKGIACQIFTNCNHILKLKSTAHNLKEIILKIRQRLLAQIKHSPIGKHENAIIESLVLGFRGDIDSSTKQAYATAGVIHILSVSGLHVGIVYYLLLSLLFFMKSSKPLRISRSIIIITGIWFYAIITGLAPPVLRSSVMFSFLAAGEALNRKGNNLNTLSASAFFMLLCNPNLLTDAGFQLSYSAMLGIFLFYQIINSWLDINTRIMCKIWELISVSLAAQLGTLPVTLLNYHQFPVYFIPANLVIVPLAAFVLYGGFAWLTLGWLKGVSSILVFLLKYLILFMNSFILWIERLPYSCIRNIAIDKTEAAILAFIIGFLALWLHSKNTKFLLAIASGALLIVISKSIDKICNSEASWLVTYHIKKHDAFSISQYGQTTVFTDSASVGTIDKASTGFYRKKRINIRQFMPFENISNKDTIFNHLVVHSFAGKNLLMVAGNKKIIYLCDTALFNYKSTRPFYADYLIVSQKEFIPFLASHKIFRPSATIVTCSLSTTENVKEIEKHTGKLIFISEQGADIQEL